MARKDSEQALLEAVETILLQGGVLGVNAVAQQSGVNKALIYRYFGSWDGLLECYAKRVNLWHGLRLELADHLERTTFSTLKEAFAWVIRQYRCQLQQAPVYLQIMRIEILDRNPLTIKLETEREEEGQKIAELIEQYFPATSLDPAVSVLFVSTLTYLCMRSKDIRWFNGLDLKEEAAWQQIENVLLKTVV